MKFRNKCLFMIGMCIIAILILGCNDNLQNDDCIKDELYLELPENIDFQNLSKSELDVLYNAYSRLKIVTNGEGLREIVNKSHEEIHISKNIFDFYERMVDNTNRFVLGPDFNIRKSLLTRSEQDYYRINDCVAWAIDKSYICLPSLLLICYEVSSALFIFITDNIKFSGREPNLL